jgi:hypothetical protein
MKSLGDLGVTGWSHLWNQGVGTFNCTHCRW